MANHPLDRPIWNALIGRQAALAIGDSRARRFVPEFSLFAAARDDSPVCLAALGASLPVAGAILLQAGTAAAPPGTVAVRATPGVQMLAAQLSPGRPNAAIVDLHEADAAEMLALATLTEPGPFFSRTHQLGDFVGIRDNGRLVAMAGERLKPDGHTEVSGVCTHPEHRGRGYAGALMRVVAGRILDRGERPFLHAYASNTGAIALYESIGFAIRGTVTMTLLSRS